MRSFHALTTVVVTLLSLLLATPALAADPSPTITMVSEPVVQPLPLVQPTENQPRTKRGELCPPVPKPTDPWPAQVVSLVGGCQSTSQQQHFYAQRHQLRFMQTPYERDKAFRDGLFVSLADPNIKFNSKGIQGPFALPPIVSFTKSLAAQYRAAGCGLLVVNSGTRSVGSQPKNASGFSLHPAGLAVDLAIPAEERCDQWLQNYLRDNEAQKRIDATWELNPAHYHIVWVLTKDEDTKWAQVQDHPTPAR